MLIGFDLDGTVVDFVEVFIKILKSKYNIIRTHNDFTSYPLEDHLNLNRQQINREIESSIKLYKILNSYDFALSTINYYYLVTNNIPVFITARSSSLELHTRKWLDKNLKNIPYELYFTSNKANLINKLNIDIFIEDSVEHCIDITNNTNCYCLLLNRPWNINKLLETSYSKRVYSWYQIHNIIERMLKYEKYKSYKI